MFGNEHTFTYEKEEIIMKKIVIVCFACLIVVSSVFLISGCSSSKSTNSKQTTITISAAASLTESLNKIVANFEKTYPNVLVRVNYGASGALRQQIEQGAKVDLFLPVSLKDLQTLESEKLIDPSKSEVFAKNILVLIVPKGNPLNIKGVDDLKREDVKRIAIGAVPSVPAGVYAKESMEKVGLFNELKDKFIYAKDVRQVLDYVNTSNVDAGFVYRTDAAIVKDVEIASTIPDLNHKPIEYYAAIINSSKNQDISTEFMKYLLDKDSQKILSGYGFLPPKTSSEN